MNEQLKRQATDFMKAASEARIPEGVQQIAEDTVAKTREAYARMAVATKDSAKVAEEVFLAAHAGARVIGEKMLANTAANTEAMFDAAQAIVKAKTLPEAARLQATFMQSQMALAGNQAKELFELSTRVAQQTFETMSAAAGRQLEQLKKVG